MKVARNAQNSMGDCNFLRSFRACFRTLRACKIQISPASHGMLRLYAQDGVKITSEAYLKDILCNLQCFEPLTETSANRKQDFARTPT